MRLRAFWRGLQTGSWLTIDWVASRARVLLIMNLTLTLGAVVVTHKPMADGQWSSVDFVSFYAAGRLARVGLPALAYDREAHQQAEAAAIGPGRPYQFFFYPPPYLLLCAALASLPYFQAFLLFEALSLGLFLLVVRQVTGSTWRRQGEAARARWLLPVLAFTPLFWAIGLGQNALLTAALLGGATLLIDRHPALAGLLLGTLCYKPHLGLLVPVALAAGGHWRGFAAAAASAAGWCGLSWRLYGSVTWQAYLHSFLASGQVYGSGRVSFAGMVSPFGAARLAGLPATPALAIQAAATIASIGVVFWVWRRARRPAVRAATLLASTMIALPVLLLYDQLITLMAIVWLAREGSATGFRRCEKLLLAAAFLLPLLTFPLAMLVRLPLAPLPAILLLALCMARVLHPQAGIDNV